jgi:hypothetical protein
VKRIKRVDAARSKAAPVPGTRTQTVADKILPLAQTAAGMAVPLAQTAAGKVVPLAQTAAAMAVPIAQNAAAKAGPLAQTAAAAAVPLAQSAVAKAGPLAQTAAAAAVPLATHAVTAISPYAHSAVDAVSPYAHTVADRVAPYATKAGERLAPLAAGGAHAAHEAAERVGPALEEAYHRVGDTYGKVGPAFESAKDRMSEELLPKLSTALGAAAASPIAVEAVKRGRATVAAARGELTLPEPKKSGSWVKRVAVVAAVAGIVALVGRRLLGGSTDSGWQAARPSTPTSSPAASTGGATTSTTPATSEPSGGEFGAAGDDPQGGVSAHVAAELANGQAEPDQPAEGGDEAALVGGNDPVGSEVNAEAGAASRYGEGAYVGDEPPEGYIIKGNENSMKYHLPDGSGYHSTKAEVWFNSEEAAKAAGFLPVQE